MRRFILPGLIAAAAVALLALLTFGVSKQSDTSSIDAQVAHGTFPMAPDASHLLPVLGSTTQSKSLADFHGKVVVLNVFASWCDPCAAEAPILAKEQHALAKRGATPAVVGKALGHETTETMAVYVDIAREEMGAEMQNAAF